ncbi:tandem-95 repeat protein [Altererythrobacter soli]|uniref:Tandem-95 repeat protein n=1 Tax=Croceibacterium soli TaxID=1739690 RepID=A0A6I4URK4_9SPHN|nr:Ig-like domain-containing protein [Croceibacterium soli]MXP41610.1 tandem-95 repeat protein [Croceibacterium soli]
MMDFEGQGGNAFDNPDFAQTEGGSPLPVAGAGVRIVLTPDSQGVVVLPAGLTLQDIQIQGRDLVVIGADGARYVIVDGAMVVPQIVVEGVAVPPANLAALLVGNEPEPAAGPPRSSGGNFADPVGPLQDAFGLGDLLPYTELQFTAEDEREVIPAEADPRPDISIEVGNSGVSVRNAEASVSEAGLPARAGEPAGSNSAADSESTFGFINFSSPDGTSQVALNGVPITAVGQTFATPFGVLTITSIADGRIGYSYTLTDNTADPAPEQRFTVTITDSDGDTATATLVITIADDAPNAANDTDSVAAGSYAAIGGNVITGQGTDSGAAGADTLGADNARVTAVANSAGQSVSGSTVLVIQGAYGTLTLNGDGSYSYQRAPGTPGGSTDTFTYTLTDGDGDSDTATLTIAIGDAPATVTSVPLVGDGTVVDEAGLPPRGTEAPGSAEATDVETTSGTITFAAPDGVAGVSLNGVVVTGAGQQIALPQGTLTIVSYDPVAGTLEYSFTLADNTFGDATQIGLSVTVTDTDGDSDTEDFVIMVVDDTPLAVDDSAAQGAENAPVMVDVFANDTPGADSVSLVSGIALVAGSLSGSGTVVYNNDGTFTYTPAPGEEGTVTFDYTITDGDGDTSTATVTIVLAPDSTPTIDVIEAQGGAMVHEAGLPAGSNAAADSETTVGTFAIATGNDPVGSLVINGVNVTGGGTVAGAHGTLTVSLSGGSYSYSYTLTGNTAGDGTQDVFSVVVTDSDGDSASAPLVIDIVDDVPTARADADSVGEDTALVADGNVLTGSGGTDANASDGVADTRGADGASVTTTGSFAGLHGTLVLAADGSYSYTLGNGSTAVQGLSAGETLTEVFTYTIRDGDGDTSAATLTITINGTDDGVSIGGLDGAGAEELVDEADLADGSSPDAAALTQAGTFTFTAPDGLDDVGIGGTQVVTNGVFTPGLTASSPLGTVTITAFTPVLAADGSIVGGTFSYSYTLGDNTLAHAGAGRDSVTDSFGVTVTDVDGSSATASLDIRVVDDVPTAQADANSVAEGAVAAGNVVGNDKFGADGAAPGGAVTGVAAGSDPSSPITGGIGGVIAGQYGTLTLNADGSYTYDGAPDTVPPIGAVDTFVYTITDGDGDTSTTTLTITLSDSGLAAANEDAAVDEAALATGSDPLGTGETASGTLANNVSGGTGPYSFALVGGGAGSNGTLTLNADGTWSYTLATRVDGATSDNGPNTLNDVETFTYRVTDANGNTVTQILTIDIVDDVPTARADAATQAAENAPIVIDALANDVFGADGVAPASVSVATQPAFGTVSYSAATGLFTYTPAPGAGSASLTDSFTYTIVDGDGDSSTATVTITLRPDSQPVVEAVTAAVDDDGLGGSALSGTGDIDANAGEVPFSSSEAVFNGKIDVNFGADGGTVTLANLHGTAGQVGAEAVTYGWDEGSRTLTATGARGPLFSVTLQPDGTYTVTLLDNVLHSAGGDETSAPAVVLDYLATDGDDGDPATGTLTITFNDDAPFATDNSARAEEGESVSGNVLTDGTPDQFGADGAAAPGAGVIGFAQGGTSAAPGGSISTTLGTLTLNADGSYTYVAKSNTITADTTDTFTYTIEDGDGDRSTATLTINVSAVTGTVSDDNVLVNEAGLNGSGGVGVGSAAGTDSETDSNGSVTASGGTPPYTYSITSTPGSPVGTLTLDSLTGAYSYTLDGPIDGPTAADGAQTLSNVESYGYEVRDILGNLIGTGTIVIDVVDDVPTARADAGVVVAEDSPAAVGGNVLTNDTPGADGATMVSVNIGGTDYLVPAAGTTIPLANGTYTFQANGAWTFDPATGLDHTGGAIDASFTYTIEDGDGDRSSASQPISITDGAGPTAGPAIDLVVDDENLADGSNPATPVTDSQDIVFTAGSDAIATVAFGLDLSGLSPSLSWTRVDGDTIVGRDGATPIVTLQLTRTGNTATVTATLHDNLSSHPGIDADDLLALGSVDVIATDSDGDTATSSVSISVSDDVPVADDDANSVTEGLGNTAAGNVFGATGSSPGDDADSIGADGPAAGGAVTGVRVGTEPSGGALATVAGATVVSGAYGNLTINPDGTYSYQLTTASIPTGVTSETFTYRITDGDGDTDLAELVIALNQDANAPNVTGDARTVYEDGLADGAQYGATSETVTGTFTVAANGEGYTLTLDGDVGGPVTILAAGDKVTTSKGELTITSISAPVGGVVTYGYSYTLSGPLTHTGAGEANPLLDTITMTVTDATGDSDGTPGSIVITIVDDVPTAIAPAAASVVNKAGSSTTAALDLNGVTDNFGADGPGLITFANIAQGSNSGMTSGGTAITQWLSNDGQTLQGRINSTDGSDGTLIFEIDLNQGASNYTIAMSGTIDNGAGVSFSNLTSTNAGNDLYRGVGANSAATKVDLLLSGSAPGGAPDTVNTNNTAIGVGNQSVGPGDTLRIDFVSNLTSGAATPSGFGFTGHVSTISFLGRIAEVQGNQNEQVNFKVWALNTTLTQSGTPDRNPAGGFSDSSTVTITEVTVRDYATGGTTTVDISSLPVTGAKAIAYGISVVRNADGSITFQGVQEGDSYGFKTSSGTFDAVAVQGLTGGFDVGTFSIGTIITGDPIDFSYDLQITDGDGDSVLMPDALNITANPATPPVALDLDGDGVEFLGLDASVAYDYGDGLRTTGWVARDDGLLARNTGSGLDIVFTDDAVGATSDLEGVRLGYDSDGDGLLTAADHRWASFGVWQDANSNGKVDAGEFRSLAEAGITSIGLVSDGQSYSAADGDVLVQGTASFTRADGSTGDVADALFATTAQQKADQRTVETVVTAAAAGALLVPQPVLADDRVITADVPLERIDAGLIDPDAPEPAGFATEADRTTDADLFEAAVQAQPANPAATADLSDEDFAPAQNAAADAPSASVALDSASEPAADFGGSVFAGFDADVSGGALMEALLALQATPAQPAALQAAAIGEALGEAADSAAVDAVIDHYAGGEAAEFANWGGDIEPAMLLQALDGHVFAGNGAVISDAMDDAATMAAMASA